MKNQVIAKGFSSNKDFVSDIVDIDEGRAFIINVDNIENEKPYELNEVFETVSNDWLKDLKIKNIESKLDEIIELSKTLSDIAKYFDAEISNEDIKLDDINFPSVLKKNVFEQNIENIFLNIDNDEIYISRLNKISFPSKEENLQPFSMLTELRSNFGAELIKNKNISTNDSLIQALINQY